MKNINSCRKVLVAFSLFFILTLVLAEVRVEIDTQTQLEAVGEILNGKCTSYDNFVDINCKNVLPVNPGNRGYWSSCLQSNCDLLIRLTDVDGGQDVPIRIEVLGYADGIGSHLQFMWRQHKNAYFSYLGYPVSQTGGWTTTVKEIDPNLRLTKASEIAIRLTSSSFGSDFDLVDKIILVYSDTEPEPLEPLEDVWDNGPSPIGWTTDCDYQNDIDDFSAECPMNVPAGTGIGFWSSCAQSSCTMRYTGRNTTSFHKYPYAVTINSYVSRNASITVWGLYGLTYIEVVTIRNTQWTDTTFYLPSLGLETQLVFQLRSTIHDSVDLIGKITVWYEHPPTEETTEFTTELTSESTSESTSEFTTDWTSESTSESTSEFTTDSTSESTTESASKSTSESTTDSTTESATESKTTTMTTPAPTTITTTQPPTTTTTQSPITETPGVPDEVLDYGTILPAGWSAICEYRVNHENFGSTSCPMHIPVDSNWYRTGFWSSCGKYCTLTYAPWKAQKPSPTSVTVNSFVSGHATLDIWVRVREGVLKLVGTVKDTTWTNVTFPICHLELDEYSEILFEPFSTRYPNHVDLIDSITISFS